ncbi:MAG TPA: DNA ligase D [Solirubrobacteraceae bacterium]|nr:DNA ligase D [Solirubrobacteraceae bacterium]
MPSRPATPKHSAAGDGERLSEYGRKRSFERTPEPPPPAAKTWRSSKPKQAGAPAPRRAPAPRFVVHEHHARRLHWDLRLERDGALASWAIPNGIPGDPKHNRKAIHVEDHPLDYIDFEGEIPQGEYGAGQVSVWDRGTYECEKWREDEVIVTFRGGRLRGRYALFQAGREAKDWMIHRMDPPLDRTAEEMPRFVAPMLASPARSLPADDGDWALEVKWDGVRAIAVSAPGRIRLWSRNRNDVTSAYPELRALNGVLGSHSAILDGEIVAFADDGRPSFELLQTRMHVRGAPVKRLAKTTPVTYVLFDLLWLDGHSLMELPFAKRRELLAALIPQGQRWIVPEYHLGDAASFLAATREQGLEGAVAKRLDSRYAPGRRDAAWLKVKNANRQEVVIGGYTTGRGARAATIGALHLGVHEREGDAALRYVGKVGTGFDDAELERLADVLKEIEREASPFAGAQPPRGAHFVEPSLVCEVSFGSWTQDGILRHSVYKGMREDKPAAEVVREPLASTRPADARAFIPASGTKGSAVEMECEGRALKLTNLNKILYPKTGFTKRDLIEYYAAIAPALLPHLSGRPLTLKRYPDGVAGESFFEKHCPSHRPHWVKTVAVWSESNKREIEYCLCEDLSTLVWLANLAAIELHPSLSRAKRLDRPSAIAFDLDPGAPASVVECCRVALRLRALFCELGLDAYPKTSGSKGLQVYVPLNSARVTYEQTKPFAHAVADVLERRDPGLVVSRMARSRRRGKVLIDWSQNDEHKTTVAAYSLRARPLPGVSTPLDWDEVERCEQSGDASWLAFDPRAVVERVSERGDLFARVESQRQPLPKLDA